MSAVFKLDNCLLWCSPDSYRTISRYFIGKNWKIPRFSDFHLENASPVLIPMWGKSKSSQVWYLPFPPYFIRGTSPLAVDGPSFVKIERIRDIIRPILRSASMESSPIKTVSVKLEIAVQKWRKSLFLFALLTRLGSWWSVSLAKGTTTTQPAFNFF